MRVYSAADRASDNYAFLKQCAQLTYRCRPIATAQASTRKCIYPRNLDRRRGDGRTDRPSLERRTLGRLTVVIGRRSRHWSCWHRWRRRKNRRPASNGLPAVPARKKTRKPRAARGPSSAVATSRWAARMSRSKIRSSSAVAPTPKGKNSPPTRKAASYRSNRVPGGVVGLTGLTFLFELFGSEALTLYATTELVGQPVLSPTSFALPIRVHFDQPQRASRQQLLLGVFSGGTFVDNSFGAPGANGCVLTLGFIPISINGLVNSQSGLPSPAGTNETAQNFTLELASRKLVYP
jgi:hypothetical protein